MTSRNGRMAILPIVLGLVCAASSAFAQAPAATPAQDSRAAAPGPPPAFVSPEVSADRRITFRVYAPQAQAVRLAAGDIPGVGQATQLTRGADGVWDVTVGPVEPGAFRYTFDVDGVATVDPRSPFTSESNNNVWSLVTVPGSDVSDVKQVPHGAVAAVTYHSTSLGTTRRMHVYTPPGYESGSTRYPVFYLLHGASDSDHSWSSVGRANVILDNLIAAKQARPMIVVMPAGHTRRGPGGAGGRAGTEEFVADFLTDIVPHVEKNYRVLTDRKNTAIAGLSMGGNHALHIAFPRLDKFAYIGVYSSGLLGAFPALAGGGRGAAPAPAAASPSGTPAGGARPALTAAEWTAAHAKMLNDPGLKKGLTLLWFATGTDDRLITTTAATVDLLKTHGFTPVYKETPGGHTWLVWRDYLHEFVPQLFQ